jgi:type IV secretory pathway VirB6-like protein
LFWFKKLLLFWFKKLLLFWFKKLLLLKIAVVVLKVVVVIVFKVVIVVLRQPFDATVGGDDAAERARHQEPGIDFTKLHFDRKLFYESFIFTLEFLDKFPPKTIFKNLYEFNEQ